MRFRLLSSVLVSVGMIATPIAAAPIAPSAAKLSLTNVRGGPVMSNKSRLGEGAAGIYAIAMLAGIAAIVIVGELASDDDNDSDSN